MFAPRNSCSGLPPCSRSSSVSPARTRSSSMRSRSGLWRSCAPCRMSGKPTGTGVTGRRSCASYRIRTASISSASRPPRLDSSSSSCSPASPSRKSAKTSAMSRGGAQRRSRAPRSDPLADFSLISRDGRQVPLDQVGHSEIRFEEPLLKRRDRVPTITVRSDINDATQPPEVSKQVLKALQPLIVSLPAGYRIDMAARSKKRPRPTTRWRRSSRS